MNAPRRDAWRMTGRDDDGLALCKHGNPHPRLEYGCTECGVEAHSASVQARSEPNDQWDDDDTVIVDVIDRAGTRHEFARVSPASAWPAVGELILEGAWAEADRYHGTTQAYMAGDPTDPLPGEGEYETGEAYRHDEDA